MKKTQRKVLKHKEEILASERKDNNQQLVEQILFLQEPDML